MPTADGVVTRSTTLSFVDALATVEDAIATAGLTVFARFDHAGGADAAGLAMPPSTVVVFGNPAAGTAPMLARPLLALDLPLRLLVWSDDRGQVQLSYQSPDFVARRFGVSTDRQMPLHAVEAIATAVAPDLPPAGSSGHVPT
jgi:uncharacterized protein (DUF302 family)